MKQIISTTALVAAALLAASAQAQTAYGSAADFAAATTGVTTVDFEGQPTGTSTWILQSGPYTTSGITISQQAFAPSPYQNAFRTDPSVTSYYYDWGTGDVVNTPYAGTLTITFAAPVTAFGIDLGVFFDDNDPATPAGAASTLYGKGLLISTAQGNYQIDTAATRTLTFFGLTSDTAFTSFSISGLTADPGASIVLDNVRYGTALVPAAVPEPASWAMMLGGFGLVGGALRARRKAQATFA